VDPWLQRLRHDLVKRALWPARDLRAALAEGRSATPADLAALRAGLLDLRAPDGAPCDALTLLGHLKHLAPDETLARLQPGLAAFEEAVAAAQEAARAQPLDAQTLMAALAEVERRFDALR
jgi:hypothetical protein